MSSKFKMVSNQVGPRLACARLSDSIRSGNVLKAKLRRARLGKGGGGGGKNGRAPARFSHFLFLNDFPLLSRSLEQARPRPDCKRV